MSNSQGIILKGVGGLYTVYEDGVLFACSARGILRKDGTKLLVGDRVRLSQRDMVKCTAVIDEILPRKTSLIRPKVANVDKLFLLVAAGNPKPDLYLVDKMLIYAEQSGVQPVLVINKSDQDEAYAKELVSQYKNAATCFITSSSDKKGTKAVCEAMNGYTCVLAGQSGVGKSTFLNLASGGEQMATGNLSDKTMRGKHTTRHAEIFEVRGEYFTEPTFLIDSPGFSMLELNFEAKDLPQAYPEVYNNQGECRFQDCRHLGEPGCFVRGLVEQGIFHPERYKRYCEFYKELLEKEKNKYR